MDKAAREMAPVERVIDFMASLTEQTKTLRARTENLREIVAGAAPKPPSEDRGKSTLGGIFGQMEDLLHQTIDNVGDTEKEIRLMERALGVVPGPCPGGTIGR